MKGWNLEWIAETETKEEDVDKFEITVESEDYSEVDLEDYYDCVITFRIHLLCVAHFLLSGLNKGQGVMTQENVSGTLVWC